MQFKKQQLELEMEFQTGSKERSTSRLYIVTMFVNFYAEYIMRNAELDEALLGEISVTSDMQLTPPLWQKVKKN